MPYYYFFFVMLKCLNSEKYQHALVRGTLIIFKKIQEQTYFDQKMYY